VVKTTMYRRGKRTGGTRGRRLRLGIIGLLSMTGLRRKRRPFLPTGAVGCQLAELEKRRELPLLSVEIPFWDLKGIFDLGGGGGAVSSEGRSSRSKLERDAGE